MMTELRPTQNGTTAADEQAVRDLFRRLLAAWGRGDGEAYGALFTEDADYVAFDGSNRRGTRAIATEHQQLFDTWLKGTRLVGQIDTLRFLGPDVALVHASGGTIFPGQKDTRAGARRSRRSSPSGAPTAGGSPPSTTPGSSAGTPSSGCSTGSPPACSTGSEACNSSPPRPVSSRR